MTREQSGIGRRAMLKSAAALALGRAMLTAQGAAAQQPQPPPPPQPQLTSRPGDFEFLAGEWRIRHRQRQQSGEWIEYDGEATVHSLLAGVASIEELRIPSRNFSGMGVRLLDVEGRRWADYWVSSRTGILSPPPMWGGFADGAGIFTAEDNEGGVPMLYRGVWDRITPTSCRWRQGSSRDGGTTWDETWFMDWRRV